MIVSAIDAQLQSLIDYLNKHYPTTEDVTLVVLPGYDSVGFWDTRAWAAYEPLSKVLWVPGDVPELPDLSMDEARQVVYEHVVHEYIHHIQACEGRDFDEDEAEERAQEIVRTWMREVSSGGLTAPSG